MIYIFHVMLASICFIVVSKKTNVRYVETSPGVSIPCSELKGLIGIFAGPRPMSIPGLSDIV